MVFRDAAGESPGRMVALYRTVSLVLSIAFAIVGLLFLFFSGEILALFNRISDSLGAPRGPEETGGLYLALAVSYMYLVALIAFLMHRRPHDRSLPLLLINGKAASSFLSVALYLFDHPFIIYGTNAVIDGGIALGVFFLYKKCMGRVP